MCLRLFGGSRDDASLWAQGQGPIPAQTPQPRQLTKYVMDAELFHVKKDFSKQEKVFLPYSAGHLLIQFFLGSSLNLTTV